MKADYKVVAELVIEGLAEEKAALEAAYVTALTDAITFRAMCSVAMEALVEERTARKRLEAIVQTRLGTPDWNPDLGRE